MTDKERQLINEIKRLDAWLRHIRFLVISDDVESPLTQPILGAVEHALNGDGPPDSLGDPSQ